MNSKKILIISDQTGITELIEYTLLTKPYWEILEANSAKEGIRQAKSYNPDLILLNMLMLNTNTNIAIVLNRLKQSNSLRDIPIIVFTDNNLTTQEEKNYKNLKVSGIIKKPINLLVLENEIEAPLNRNPAFLSFFAS